MGLTIQKHIETFKELTDTPNSYTDGQILFMTASGVEGSSDLQWDSANKKLSVSGDLVVDIDTLYVDSANGNVGIGTTELTTRLTIKKPIDSSAYGAGTRMIDLMSYYPGYDEGTVKASIYAGVSNQVALQTTRGYLAFLTSDYSSTGEENLTEKVRIESNGNVGIRTTDQFGSGEGVLALANASTNPSSNPTDAIILFAKDYDDGDGTASSELFVRDEDGNETNLSPHAFELYQPDSTDPFPWTYHSTNYLIGKKINVDMSGAIRELERLTGKKFIHVEDVEKIPLSEHIKAKKEVLIKKWQEENAEEVEIALEEAVEEVEVEVEDKEQVVGSEKMYRFENGEVVEEEIPVYAKKKEMQKRLKSGVRFDEKTGKFYKKVLPSRKDALKAIKQDPKFRVRRWIKDRIDGGE